MSDTKVNPTIFREYIGAKSLPGFHGFPEEVINKKVPEFHFILAFAKEEYDEAQKCTGKFNVEWDLSVLNPENAKKLKHTYPNVKVVFSIGGRGSPTFNTDEKDEWVENANQSLTKIIADFNDYCGCNLIDGIDVNYEKIDTTEDYFADAIGRLIQGLKENNNGVIKVVSIAPSHNVQSHYRHLYKSYRNYIDWVDYQFYDEAISTSQDFVDTFTKIYSEYLEDKNLLAGFSTDPADAGKIKPQVFIDGCRTLLQRKLLKGIFVWDAEDSWHQAKDDNPYKIEDILQNLLLEFHN